MKGLSETGQGFAARAARLVNVYACIYKAHEFLHSHATHAGASPSFQI